ncbi:MAG: M36 family metallopeptidase [Phycisphaerae bacterium]
MRRRFAIEGLEARVMLAAGGVEQLAAPWSPAGRFLHKDSGFLSAPSRKAPLSVALAYLSAHAADLGLMAADVANPFVTDQYTDADTGVTHLYFRQRVNHIAVANANLNVNVARDGRVLSVGGGFVGGASTSPRGARAVARAAAVTAAGAVDSIFKLLPGGRKAGSRVDAVRGRDLATFNAPELSLDPIAPAMHYVAVAGGGLKLAWNLAVRTPDRAHWYDLNVDAATGAGLSRTDWVSHATYHVYPLPVESPDDGTRAALTDPHDPVASPFGWHDTNGVAGAEFTDIRGNNVSAQDDIDANNSGGTRPDGGAALNFDFPLVLTGAPSTYRPAATTQMFYVNNALHDIHSRYGFTESAGNFQVTNYGGQGAGNDAVQADAQDGSGTNNANFATPPDGTAPRMQMYLFNYTSPGRDGDLDTQIVIHEYGHGVSNRLTGGPANSNALNATQSGGMGEGWSDWWGLMLTQKASDLKAGRYPVGTYVLGHNATTGAGIRRYPYSFDMAVDPLTIAAYNSDPSKEVHNTGEIWSTVLWDLNWLLIDKYGFSPTVAAGYDPAVAGKNGGNNLALQLVTDALKLQPANPSFKDARDAILQADQVRTGGANRFQIWTAFARRGMGYSFVNTSSSGSTVTPATDLPPDLLKPRVVGHVPTAPQTAPLAAVDLNFSEAMNPASFAIADDLAAFTGPGGTDLLGQVTGFTWLNGNSTLRLSFSPQSVNGRYAITVGPQILAADDGTALDQDADGTAGEATADQYTATIGFDALPLAVTAASPASGTTVAPPVTFIELSFNEAVDPASIGTGDLSLSQGSVTGATLVDPTTVRYTLSGVTTEGALTYTLAAGAVTDADGFASAAFTGNLAVDIGTRALPAPTAIAPAASLAYRATGGGVIGVAADVDDFTLPLDAGQTVTVVVTPAAGLRAAVTLTGPGGAALGAATATAAGLPVALGGLPVATAGLYTVGVAGVAGTGAYTVEVLLNADVAREDVAGGTTDDTFATAQPVAVAGTPLGASGGSVTTVLGKLPTPAGYPIVSDGFESGSLGPAWTTYSSSSQGRIRVSAAQTPQAGANALFMDVDDSAGTSYVLNEAVWTVNLAGATSPTLSFYATTFSDDSDALPTTFTGHYDGDGVSISADGVTWYTVWTNTYPSSWTNVSINLAAAAQAAGLTLGANFKVKFQQYDNFSMTTDGFGWDSVAVTVPAAAQDNYAITAPAGQWLSIAAARTAGAGTPVVTVYDAAGVLLATGVAPSGSATSGIHSLGDSFLVPADGT